MTSSNTMRIRHKQHQSPFLSLPFEVRYQIYKDIANLSQATFWSYRGLYLACKVIHTEMTSECERQLRGTFQTLVQTGCLINNVHLGIPLSFSRMRHITLNIPWQAFQGRDSKAAGHFSTLRGFLPLFRLHLNAITIKVDCSMVHAWENRKDMSQMTFRQMVALTGMDTDSPPNTRRINYKFDFDKRDYFEQFMTGAGYAHLRDWRPWTNWDEDSAQGIVWVKSVKGEEEASYQWMRSSLRAGWWTRRHNLSQRQRMEVKMDVARRHEKGEPHGSIMVSSGRVYVEEAITTGILPASFSRELEIR